MVSDIKDDLKLYFKKLVRTISLSIPPFSGVNYKRPETASYKV